MSDTPIHDSLAPEQAAAVDRYLANPTVDDALEEDVAPLPPSIRLHDPIDDLTDLDADAQVDGDPL